MTESSASTVSIYLSMKYIHLILSHTHLEKKKYSEEQKPLKQNILQHTSSNYSNYKYPLDVTIITFIAGAVFKNDSGFTVCCMLASFIVLSEKLHKVKPTLALKNYSKRDCSVSAGFKQPRLILHKSRVKHRNASMTAAVNSLTWTHSGKTGYCCVGVTNNSSFWLT